MKLEDIQRVADLGRERQTLTDILTAAGDDPSVDLVLYHHGNRHKPLELTSKFATLASITTAVKIRLHDLDKELEKFSVRPPDPFPPVTWSEKTEMYANAWERELRGHIRHKRHHIDTLVCSTADLVKKYEVAIRALQSIDSLYTDEIRTHVATALKKIKEIGR